MFLNLYHCPSPKSWSATRSIEGNQKNNDNDAFKLVKCKGRNAQNNIRPTTPIKGSYYHRGSGDFSKSAVDFCVWKNKTRINKQFSSFKLIGPKYLNNNMLDAEFWPIVIKNEHWITNDELLMLYKTSVICYFLLAWTS